MRWIAGCAVLTLSCTGTDPARPREGPPTDAMDPKQRAAIERDLGVVLTRVGVGELDADARWPLTATLSNRGTHAHWIVRPSDGSDAGWREPHVYYTAEMETAPDVWRPVPARDDYGRCGNYATDWIRDAVEMAPGASIELAHFTDPSQVLDVRRSGRVRLYAHYDYGGGKKASFRARNDLTPLPAELAAVGPFALVSAPLEIRVRVDTSVELALVLHRRQVRVREHVTFAALAEARVVNRSAAPLDLGEDFPDSRFHVDVKDTAGSTFSDALDGPRHVEPGAPVTLHAHQERQLVSAAPGTMRLRLRYDGLRPEGAEGQLTARRFRSPWLDVQVTP
jgi:hypothetical protein